MDKRLAQLISAYQAAVGAAVLLMSESGIEMPSSNIEWLELPIPAHGELKSGIKYFKHGFGCWVQLPEGKVDFDFGEMGQIDGFDEWRLLNFCRDGLSVYGFETQQALFDCFRHALAKRMLVAGLYNLYYVVDSVKLLGQEAARILRTGCALPHRSQDSVQMLFFQCFESANLMLDHYEAINRIWVKKGKLNSSKRLEFRVYLLSWLGYLNTTAEGFREINVWLLLQNKRPGSFMELATKCGEIGSLEKRYADDLRTLRNDTFHLRADDGAITQFFADDGERMEWAKGLHAAFADFFSNYRILAEVYYLTRGRYGESQIRRESMKQKKKKVVAKMPVSQVN